MALHGKVWAYKPDGSACIFELILGGDELPPGWSHDISVITDPEKRTGEAVSAAARESLVRPVKVSKAKPLGLFEETPKFMDLPKFGDSPEPLEQNEEPIEAPLQYDQDLQQVLPTKPRGRGPLR
jgi:hypothetical protein